MQKENAHFLRENGHSWGREWAFSTRKKGIFVTPCLLVCWKFGIGVLPDGHALHLDEPAGAADGSMNDDMRMLGEAIVVQRLDELVVSDVS